MAARDEAGRKADARAFADAVDGLVIRAIQGAPSPPAADDATRLAAALVLVDRLVSQYATLCGPDISAREGVVEALKLLAALRSGGDHPLWTYARGVRTRNRIGNVQAPIDEMRLRGLTIGLTRALTQIDGSSSRQAVRTISAHVAWRSIPSSTLRKWPNSKEPAVLALADKWCRELVANARTSNEAINRTARMLAAAATIDRTPTLPAAAAKRPMFARLVDGSGKPVGEIEVTARE